MGGLLLVIISHFPSFLFISAFSMVILSLNFFASSYYKQGVQFCPKLQPLPSPLVLFLSFSLLSLSKFLHDHNNSPKLYQTKPKIEMLIEKADVSSLEQLCLNVDPNYGAMWLRLLLLFLFPFFSLSLYHTLTPHFS